jgi:hypothetical protein
MTPEKISAVLGLDIFRGKEIISEKISESMVVGKISVKEIFFVFGDDENDIF